MNIGSFKEQVDIANEISKHVVLKKTGGLYWGKCPFHKEKTPSFSVNKEKGYFHCFGCGEHGDVISFLQKLKNLSFLESIELICQENKLITPTIKIQKDEKELLDVLQLATNIFLENLEKKQKEFLVRREISWEIAQLFQIGYCDAESIKALAQGVSRQQLIESGILSTSGVAVFLNRIIFPIKNIHGKVIAFSGRTLNKETKPKYINSRETNFFSKSCTVYNIEKASQKKESVFVVEGFMDTISMYQAGFINTVATMGTAVTYEQLFYLFKKFTTVIAIFDGDESGQKASLNFAIISLSLLDHNNNSYLVVLPKDTDPDEIIKHSGEAAMSSIIDSKMNIIDYLWKKEEQTALKGNNIYQYATIKRKIQIYLEKIQNVEIKELAKEIWEQKLQIFKEKLVKKNLKPQLSREIQNSPEKNVISILQEFPFLLENHLEELSAIEWEEKEQQKMFYDLLNNQQKTEKKTVSSGPFLQNIDLAESFLTDFIQNYHNRHEKRKNSSGINRFFIEKPKKLG